MAKSKKKVCFVICPIGDEKSEARRKSDLFLHLIVEECLDDDKWKIERADKISKPGQITDQIIDLCLNSELIIADLTDNNPNVFYELGIVHMAEKRVITFMQLGQQPPFDNHNSRIIFYDTRYKESICSARKQLNESLAILQSDSFTVSNPIITARGHIDLEKSKDSRDVIIANMQDEMSTLRETQRKQANLIMSLKDNQSGMRSDAAIYGVNTSSILNDQFRATNSARSVDVDPVLAAASGLPALARYYSLINDISPDDRLVDFDEPDVSNTD